MHHKNIKAQIRKQLKKIPKLEMSDPKREKSYRPKSKNPRPEDVDF